MKNINVEIINRPIGLIASGGTDSSILMYILMKTHKDPLHIFTCSSNLKDRKNALIVPQVIEKCIQLTGNINIIHHSFYVDIQDKTNLFDYPYKFLNSGVINALYTGVTANPPYNVTEKFIDENTENSERDPTITRPTVHQNGKFHTPFTNLNKQDIANLYDTYNLRDVLFPITRSCESIGDTSNKKHCGKCWWCEERVWGFGSL